MSSLRAPCPLFITQDVAACLQSTEKKPRTDRHDTNIEHTRTHRQTLYAELTRSERVVHWAGDPSLPCKQGATQAHVVRGASDAELGQQQLPARPLHRSPSVLHRPSAGRGGSGSSREVTCGPACSIAVCADVPIF